VQRGLIVGATREIADLIQLPVDVFVVNIRESMGASAFLKAIPPLQQFFARGGVLGLGCVAVSDAVDDVTAVMQLLMPIVVQLIDAGIDTRILQKQLMVMPATSFGQTNVATATHAMSVTCQAAGQLRHYLEHRV
jgi:hypothetical protein